MPYSIEYITEVIGAKRIGTMPYTINWLLTDSRSLIFPEDTLFFGLHTKRGDGATYIDELYSKGVRNFVIAEINALKYLQEADKKYPDANFLRVVDPLKALQKLAEQHRKRFTCPIVGITGSNGKTIVKEWLHQLLSPSKRVIRSPRSYNSQIGVPLSVWQINEQTELAIVEAGISEPGEMKHLEHIVKPTIGILTNIGGAHQENFYSMQEKCLEKLTLFSKCDVLIYNGDDEFISDCVAKSMLPAKEIAWSVKDMDKPLYISKIEKRKESTYIAYRYLEMDYNFILPFIDDASIENALHCLAVSLYLLVSPEQIAERMAHLERVAMRLEVKEGKNGCMIINDSYNSDMSSLQIALNFQCRRFVDRKLKRTLILSDLLETGQNDARLYKEISKLVKSLKIDRLIGVGEHISAYAGLFDLPAMFFKTTDELMNAIKTGGIYLKNECILIKGARKYCFEELTELLEKKVHETILEVNLGAMIDNLNYYRSKLKPGTKVVCMVKASAYGAGSFEIAKTLQEHHVDYLAVAVADEGTALRKAGITANIMVMNPEMTAFKAIFDNALEPEVYSFHLLDALIKEGEKLGVTNYPIHIKLDTGMHRLGFNPKEMPQLIERLKSQQTLIVRSVFSHFVGSDNSTFDDFTRQQIALFMKASGLLQSAFSHKIIRHICNTAGIERFSEAQMEMVRLGLGLYGINPIDNRIMHNVNTLKTTILQVREIPENDTVGYSRKGVVHQNARIAAIPIGYADGLNRHLGNGNAYCLVNGQKAPYIGNICMDVCMVDVTGIDCNEGDVVEIFGDHLPVTVLSDALQTIPYEVLTSVSTRVKRVYFQD